MLTIAIDPDDVQDVWVESKKVAYSERETAGTAGSN